MKEKQGTFEEFAEYFYMTSKDDEKIYINLETENQTEETDLFEFFLNLVIFGYENGFKLNTIQKYFLKINVKLEYFISQVKVYSPYEITSDLKLKKMYDSKILFAEFKHNKDYYYMSFNT